MTTPHNKREEKLLKECDGNAVTYEFTFEEYEPDIDEIFERRRDERGFTFTELMLVVVIVGIIAAFAIPSYEKSFLRAHEKDIVQQMTMVNKANNIFRAHYDKYFSGEKANADIPELNNGLGTMVIAQDAEYNYWSDGGTGYALRAKYKKFEICGSQRPISDSNPCCSSGNCPTLAACVEQCR